MKINKRYKFIISNSEKWVVGKIIKIENGFVQLSEPTVFEPNLSDANNPWCESFYSTEFYLSLSSVFYFIEDKAL